jgi:hypothetical protein
VWKGAVQTDTLTAIAGISPLMIGLFSSLIIIMVFFSIKTNTWLNSLEKKKTGIFRMPSKRRNLIFLIISAFLSISFYAASIVLKNISIPTAFATGIFSFLTLILLLRQYYLGDNGPTRQYYRYNSTQAIAPAIFIAAGIFALFITSLNRMNFDKGALDPKGGAGGYLFWAETSLPVKEDLTIPAGRKNFGLDEDQFRGMNIVQLSRKEGDDASCLNLNHVASPPLLGVNPVQTGCTIRKSLIKIKITVS